MSSLTVSLVQTDLFWENPTANRAMLEEKICSIDQPIDLLILPEMFSTGFTMNPAKHAEPMRFTTMKWMHQMAKQSQAIVTGSVAIKEGNQYFNRLIWMQPDGVFSHYDKRHLFRMGGEADVYSAGNEHLIKEINGFKIALFICYDLRFPVWMRNLNLAYDVVLNVANWPSSRIQVWDLLLKARAIENQAYCIGVNRIGQDGTGLQHAGHSAVIDYKGNPIAEAKQAETILTTTIYKEPLNDFRAKFPAYLDADSFVLEEL